MSKKKIVIAIPIYNEEAVIPEMLRRLASTTASILSYDFSFLFIDDGSRDSSFAQLAEAARQNSAISVIKFSRNFGHQAALAAAVDNADGDALVMMDGDLQDPPEVITEFLVEFERGADVVYAIRTGRKESLWLRSCYALFYRTLAKLSHVDIPLDSGDFSLMSKRVVDTVRALPEHHRFLRGLRAWTGFKQVGIPVERAARFAGDRKYTLGKLITLAADGIFSFSVFPLRAATVLGALSIGLVLLYSLYVLVVRVFGEGAPQGFSALFLSNVMLSGIQLLFFGIIGEYVGRIYEECKGRPIYIIDKFLKR